MNVLYVTNIYPSYKDKYYGIFVKEQIVSIKSFASKINKPFVHNLIYIKGKYFFLNYLFSIVTVNWHLLFNKYDLIHIHYGLSGLFLLLNPFVKIPVIVTFHGGDIQIEQKKRIIVFLSKLIAKKAKLCIVLNDNMTWIVRKITSDVVKIPCGVNTNIFHLKKLSLSNQSRQYTVVFPGSYDRVVKNHALFKRIIFECEKNINKKINTVELKNMDRNQIADVLCSANCLLMTSISEGSPQVVKEAMACGLPVISSNVGDVSELLREVDNCHVVDSFEPSDYSGLLLTILLNGQRSKNSQKRLVELELDSESIARKIYNIYCNLIGPEAAYDSVADQKSIQTISN